MILRQVCVRTTRTLLSTSRFDALRFLSSLSVDKSNAEYITLCGRQYKRDEWTNVNDRTSSLMGKNLHRERNHPLAIVKDRILNYLSSQYSSSGFVVKEDLDPVVTVEQNFDSLLVPMAHVSRSKTDCYYVNRDLLLRGHTSAHQADLLKSGLETFAVVGDVFRRDTIDSTHYPVFHQIEVVRLLNSKRGLQTNDERSEKRQETHHKKDVAALESELKNCLLGLMKELFGTEVNCRFIDAYFPFTHPSWELEILWNKEWIEILGCGIMEQAIINKAIPGEPTQKVGWAFGLGLERIAMKLFDIPDIRLFWSRDSGFLCQFEGGGYDAKGQPIHYKTISQCSPCPNDISFWLPATEAFSSNDFYELVRSCGGDLVEQVKFVDEFFHPKLKKWSHCYRIVYRHMERTLTQEEVNVVHKEIEQRAQDTLGVTIR